MTSNQRRPGFRLPWSSDEEAAAAAQADANGSTPTNGEGEQPTDASVAPQADGQPVAVAEESELEAPAAQAAPSTTDAALDQSADPAAGPAAVAEAPAAPAQSPESSAGFMRDLVEAMRRVAEETRQAGLSELRTTSEEHVRTLEEETERRRQELRARAETDIAGVGDWARAEEERIKQEAEQKVVSRRALLDQELAGETARAEAATKALRDRVADYERELDAYHAQLSDIADPAAFAAAAKRMPSPPRLGPEAPGAQAKTDEPDPATAASGAEAEAVAEPAAEDAAPAEPIGVEAPAPEPATDATPADPETANPTAVAEAAAVEPPETSAEAPAEAASGVDTPRGATVATEVMVKGLGSFGAITGFRQQLAGVEGIDGVSLSLGPTGEFVFRAIHGAEFDVAAAIRALEGDAATIEERPEGGLRVTLDRAR